MTIIYMQNVPGEPKMRELSKMLEYVDKDGKTCFIPQGFKWDGSSVPFIFQGIFPRHRHPVASCRHDWRCRRAKCAADRKFADEQFQIDVGKTSWWVTKKLGYFGVRIGAFFGIGSNY